MVVTSFGVTSGVFSLCVLLLVVGTGADEGDCVCKGNFASERPIPQNTILRSLWILDHAVICQEPLVDKCEDDCTCHCPLGGFNHDRVDANNNPVIICTDGSSSKAECIEPVPCDPDGGDGGDSGDPGTACPEGLICCPEKGCSLPAPDSDPPVCVPPTGDLLSCMTDDDCFVVGDKCCEKKKVCETPVPGSDPQVCGSAPGPTPTPPPAPTPPPTTAPPTTAPPTTAPPTTAPPTTAPPTTAPPTTAPPTQTPPPTTPPPTQTPPPTTPPPTRAPCDSDDDCSGIDEICCPETSVCEVPVPDSDPQVCGDPHMTGLRGQKIDWSGVDGGWYCLVRDDDIDLQVNIRLTAPLADEFPDRQLITGLSILSEGHSLVVEVDDPYSVDTDGCLDGTLPCLSNGGLLVVTDGQESKHLLHPTRDEYIGGGMRVSASNLPVECRLFGGSTVWAQMYEEMMQGHRKLRDGGSFEDWVMAFDHVAAPDWCMKYIKERGLADVQSAYALFRVSTPTAHVQLHVGIDHQGGGQLDWDGRALPDLDFWQMDAGVHGLSLDSETLTGILGETARPMLDEHGREIMEGYNAMRGTVEDYRVSGALGTEFALLHKNQAD